MRVCVCVCVSVCVHEGAHPARELRAARSRHRIGVPRGGRPSLARPQRRRYLRQPSARTSAERDAVTPHRDRTTDATRAGTRRLGHGDANTATPTRRLARLGVHGPQPPVQRRPHLPHPRHLRPARASTDGGWGGARRGRGRGRGEEGGLPGDGYFHYPARFVTGKGTVTGASLPGGGRDVWGCGQGIPGRGRGTAGCGGKGSGCGGSSRVCGVTGSRPE